MYVDTMDFITTGDIVQTSKGDLYKVLKVNPSNYRCEDEFGKIWNIRRTPSVKKAAPEIAARFESKLPELKEGMAVRFTDSGARKFPGVYIITDISGGMAKFVKLGGGGGRVKGPVGGVAPVNEINSVDWS